MARKSRRNLNGDAVWEASSDPGHNSTGTIDGAALKGYRDRAARLMAEQKALGEDLKAVCAEADEAGVSSKKEIRKLARESLMDREVLQAQLDRMDALRHALGEYVTAPLGKAAEQSAR